MYMIDSYYMQINTSRRKHENVISKWPNYSLLKLSFYLASFSKFLQWVSIVCIISASAHVLCYGHGDEIWEKGMILEVNIKFNWNLMTLSLLGSLTNFKWLTNITTNEAILQTLIWCVSYNLILLERKCMKREDCFTVKELMYGAYYSIASSYLA